MSEEIAFNTMAEDLIEALGVDATYIPKIGAAVSLKVQFDQSVDYQPDGYTGRAQGYLKTIEFFYSDLNAMPAAGDQIKIGSDCFEIVNLLEHDGAGRFVKVVVVDKS